MPGLFRVVAAVCAFLSLVSPALAVQNVGEDALPTIAVNGTAELEAAPDFIQWDIVIVHNDVDPLAAKLVTDGRLEAILEIANDLDIDAGDIITGPISLQRTYQETDRGRRGAFKDYEVHRSVTLVQRDLDELDEMLEKLAGTRVEFHLSYSSTQVQAMKREARVEAVRVARAKAQEMAEALGQTLGRPLQVCEVRSQVAGFDMNNALSNTNFVRVDDGGGDLAAVGLRRGAISVTSSVSVVFVLEQPE